MANTYVAIATVTVGSGGAASMDFTSIPGTYTDLLLLASLRSGHTDWNDNSKIKFNSSASGYSSVRLSGEGTTASSETNSGQSAFFYLNIVGNTATSNTFGNNVLYIPNYTSSNQKSFSGEAVIENNSSTANLLRMSAGLWTGTAAITSISIEANSGANLLQYSTATLYGIKNS